MATILIVDDLAADREILATVLRAEGHRILEAGDGREALAIARAECPDVLITDLLMPVMDGYELVRRLRRDRALRRIPVVFYTARYAEFEARVLSRSTGVSYVLTKPSAAADVVTIVQRALSGEPDVVAVPDAPAAAPAIDRTQLRLMTGTRWEKVGELRTANARLRALVNIGLELGAERDSDRLLQRVCAASRDLFGATYVTLGILDPALQTVQRVVSCGTNAAAWIAVGDKVPGIVATVIDERRTMRGDNPTGNPVDVQLPPNHPKIEAFLLAPIASTARVYGWIGLAGNEGRSFTETDEHLLVALAAKIGRIYELEHEIVEREQAQTALRHERDRAQQYLDTAAVILLALDLHGRITLINRHACAVLGIGAGELIGRDWFESCLPERVRPQIRQKFQNLLRGDLSVVENPVLTRGGSERLIEWHNTVLRDDSGDVAGTLSSGTDITERTEAITALRAAEERMRFALQSAEIGLWDMDYTTGVLQWSDLLEAQYGIEPGTFDGTFAAFAERIHPDDRAAAYQTIEAAKMAGGDFAIQNRALRPDGTVRWLNGAGRILLDGRGAAVRGVGISMDVTERRLLEQQYHQAQKMEAVGRLAGGVAHDFNNLLTAILGYSELLLAETEPDDVRRPDIAEIHKAGTSAAALTRQLLAFSRMEIIEPVLLDLNVIVTDMYAMLQRLIGDDIKVALRLCAGVAAITADRGQVEQVVMNLAVNARDAMPRGGRLTIDTTNVDLDEHYAKTHLAVTPGRYVSLTVTDTGTGITPEVQARLFEPFFTTKPPGKGTGLGLATVHGIATRCGGSVNVYSEVNQGTSFKVYFPRASAEEVAMDVPMSPEAATRADAQTVLVVDDAEGPRMLASRLLEKHGYTVLVAASADEAMRMFDEHPGIEVLLTDVVMPGASGSELTRRLVEHHPGLKVVYMSGYTEDAIVHHGVLEPGIAFLHKPFTFDTLGRKIREVLGAGPAAAA